MKKWKCTVCGYIHTGDQPPETCPVCGADSSKFVELPSEVEAGDNETQPRKTGGLNTILFNNVFIKLMLKHHAHPISVHIPNGVIPISFVFILLAIVLNLDSLSKAAFYNLVFVAITMPMVLFSGYVEWQKKYNGQLTKFFLIKIACGFIVLLVSILTVLWMIIDPQVTGADSSHRWIFLLLNFVMLGAAGIAGFLGGKLVFKD